MSELGFWPRFMLAVLATWRVAHLLAREDGPADLVARLRAHAGGGPFGKLMDCFYCLSFWVAAPFALVITRRPLDLLLTWLALSGAACLVERVGQDPVIIQPIAQVSEGEPSDGMLRSKTLSVGEHVSELDERFVGQNTADVGAGNGGKQLA
jgi:hypothetical protein